MADLRRRISHLQGMADRLDLRENGRSGRIMAEMVDVLREIALDVEEINANQLELEGYVEEIDSDLMSLEEEVYPEFTSETDDRETPIGDFEDDDTYIELECPRCGEESYYNSALFNEPGIQLSCPHCGNIVFDADEDLLVMEADDEEEEEEEVNERFH